MASAPSISFCNAPLQLRRLAIPTHDPSNAFSSCGTLEDMVASCAGTALPVIQGPGSSMVNRLDEVRGVDVASRRRVELAMEGGICMSMGGEGYERGYSGKQVTGGGGEGEGLSWDMQGGAGGGGGGGEEEEEEEEEEELLADERQGEYTIERSRGGAREALGAGAFILERSGGGAGEEQGNVIWKKRKLSAEQVRCLERSFEVERKLEGQRKADLASQLRLQPRQIAVWFQNRRARWKSKQLEHDYLALKASFASLQAHFDDLLAQKQDLLRQVNALKNKLQQGDESLKCDASISTTYDKGIQVNIDQRNGKLEVEDIGVAKATSGLDGRKKFGEDKEDMVSKDKQSGPMNTNEILPKLEPSSLSGTEGSVVSEAINSPHAIESGVINSQSELISTSLIKRNVNSSFLIAPPLMQAPLPPPITVGKVDFFNLNNEYIKGEPIEEEDIENEHKYCFILEDHAEGTLPWWN